jgi:PTH1 family peptidyl-tRNA hydrolase
MSFLIVGLGNIGVEYEYTRHNVGFEALDAIAIERKLSFVSDRYAHKTEFRFKGESIHLIKPTTYMNLSGKAVRYWCDKLDIAPIQTLVILDDLALPFGKLRLRKSGSDGGHNGLKSINECLNTNDYPRLRVGIGSEFAKGQQVDYVLGKWSQEEAKDLPPILDRIHKSIISIVAMGFDRTMAEMNKK